MNKKSLDDAEERLLEINKVIQQLDPSIRPGAFELLKSYVTTGGESLDSGEGEQRHLKSTGEDAGLSSLMQKFQHDKPSDNVHLLAADWYRRYGSAPLGLDGMKSAAVDAGLTIPERLDMTLKSAKDGGKNLYQSAGRGLYKPTVTGELYLKKTYGVGKGTNVPTPVS
jgi:hypothetical protein